MPVAGVLAGPLLAAALTATTAAGFAVPLLIIGDLIALALYRQHADWGLIRRLIPGVLVGFAITALLFALLDVRTIARIIGALILASVALEALRRRSSRMIEDQPAAMTSRWGIAFFGTLAGMTTMAANAGGAAMTIYLVKMRVPMLAFMGTSTWFFFVMNSIKVPIVAALGLLTWETLLADLIFLPALVVGAGVGIVIFRRMNQDLFTTVALALSGVVALWLIIHG